MSIEDVIIHLNEVPEAIRTAVRNNGGGHYNHSLFWKMMAPVGQTKPSAFLLAKIDESFGSFDEFKKQFAAAATSRFGSGWAWLVADGGKLDVGTCLLLEISDPPRRLCRELLSGCQLGLRRRTFGKSIIYRIKKELPSGRFFFVDP